MSHLDRYLVSVDDIVRALTSAVDLVGTDEVHHSKRVALMGATFAQELGWPIDEQVELFRAAMLHDCGVSRSSEHHELVAQLEWAGADEHCLRGEAYLADVPYLAGLAPVVRRHHTRWSELPGDVDETVVRHANLIFLADRMDALRGQYDVARHPQGIPRLLGLIRSGRGTLFAPRFVDVAEEVAQREAFWFALEDDVIEFGIDMVGLPRDKRPLNWSQMRMIGVLFARIIDAKSQFTADHSLRVAVLARHLARRMGLSERQCEDVELAGLLHDLGKLRIPDELLDKKGSFDFGERRAMTRHAFETYVLLRRLFGDHPIACWAAWHHENLEGTGYPFRRKGAELPIEARLIAVADRFQALLQDRPYRPGKTAAEAVALIEDEAARGLLDVDIVGRLQADLAACVRAATGRTADPVAGRGD